MYITYVVVMYVYVWLCVYVLKLKEYHTVLHPSRCAFVRSLHCPLESLVFTRLYIHSMEYINIVHVYVFSLLCVCSFVLSSEKLFFLDFFFFFIRKYASMIIRIHGTQILQSKEQWLSPLFLYT